MSYNVCDTDSLSSKGFAVLEAIQPLDMEYQKTISNPSYQRERAQRRFGLGAVFGNQDPLAVFFRFCDRMSDGDRIPLEVNCVPLNAEHFAASQAVKGGHLDQQ